MTKKKLKKNECPKGYGIIKQRLRDKDGRTVHITDDSERHISKWHFDEVRYIAEIENILLNYDEIVEGKRDYAILYFKHFNTEDGKRVKILLVTHGCVHKPEAGKQRRVNHVSTLYDYDKYKRG